MSTQNPIEEQIAVQKAKLESEGFLVFEGTLDNHRILQNLCYHPSPPPLAVFCEQWPGLPPIGYLNFVPNNYAAHIRDGMVEILGTSNGVPRSIYVHTERNFGMTGDIVSLVAIPKSSYPTDFFKSFPEPVMTQETPPRARLNA